MRGFTRQGYTLLLLTLASTLLLASGQRNSDAAAIKSATEDELASELGEIPPETFLQRLSRAGAVMSDDEDERRPRGLLAALMGYPDDFEDVNPEDMKSTPSGRASIYSRAKGTASAGKKPKSAKTTKPSDVNATTTTSGSTEATVSATTPEAVNKSIKREAIPTTSATKVATGNGQPIPAGYILWHPVPASFVENQMAASASAASPTTTSAAAAGTGLPHQPFFIQPPQFADMASGFPIPQFSAPPTAVAAAPATKTKAGSKGRQRGSSSKKTPRPKSTRNKNRNKATTRPEVVETTPSQQQFQQQQNDFRNNNNNGGGPGGPFFPVQDQFPRPQQQQQQFPGQFQNGGGQQFPQQQQNGGGQQFRNNAGPPQQQQFGPPQFQQNGPQQFGPAQNRPQQQQQFPFSQQQQNGGGQQFRNNIGPQQQFPQNIRPQQQNGPQQFGPQINNRPQQQNNFQQNNNNNNQFRAGPPQQGPNNFQQGQRFNGPQQQQQRFPPQQQQQPEVIGQQSQRLTQTQNNLQKPSSNQQAPPSPPRPRPEERPFRPEERPFNMGHQFANFNNPNFQSPQGGAGGGPGFGPFFDGPMFNQQQFGGPNPFPNLEQEQRMREFNGPPPNFMEPPGMRFPFPPPLPPPPPPSFGGPNFFPPNSSPRPPMTSGSDDEQKSRGLSSARPQLPPPTQQQNAIASASFAEPHFAHPLPGPFGGPSSPLPPGPFGFNPNLNPIYSRDFLKSSTTESSTSSNTGSTSQSGSTVSSVSGKGANLDREAAHKQQQRNFNNGGGGGNQLGLPLSQLQRFPAHNTGNNFNNINNNNNNSPRPEFLPPQTGNAFFPAQNNFIPPPTGNGNIFPPSPRPFADFPPPPRPEAPFPSADFPPAPPGGSPFAQFEHQLRKPEPDAHHFRTSLPPVSASPHLPNFNGDVEQKVSTSTLSSAPASSESASPNTPHGSSYPSPGFHNGHKGFPSSVTAPHPTFGLQTVTSAPAQNTEGFNPEATNLTPFFSSSTSGPATFHYEVKYQTQAPPSQ